MVLSSFASTIVIDRTCDCGASLATMASTSDDVDRVVTLVGDTRSTSSDVEAIVANEAPQSQVLSMTIVDANELRTIEPTLGTGQAQLFDPYTVWIVRVLESERISTYLVIDGSDAIYEMNPENVPILVGGTPPTPGASSSPGPWPPAGALVLELPGIDVGKPPVRVAIVDESGRFVSAMAQDPPTFSPEGRFGADRGARQTGTRQPGLGWRRL